MERSSQHPALILHTRPSGESHLYVDLLTPDKGLLSATAYGARSQRGSLRGSIVPFAYGVAYLYSNPRRDVFKVSDFDVRHYYLGVRESLDALYSASLWAEIVLKTFGGGEDERILEGLLDALDVLETVAEAGAERTIFGRLTSQWIWRYAELLGVRPELPAAGDRVRWFAPGNHGFTSIDRSGNAVEISDGTVRYLQFTASLPIAKTLSVPMREETERNLRHFSLLLAHDLVHGSLNTLQSGWSPW